MSDELVCLDCADANCTEHLRWIDDGLGNWQQQCRLGCDVMVVRPGRFQCSCDEPCGCVLGTEHTLRDHDSIRKATRADEGSGVYSALGDEISHPYEEG